MLSLRKPSDGTPRLLVGILQIVLSTWALSGLDTSAKWLLGAGASLLIVCWFRYVGHLLFVLALILPSEGTRILRTHHPRYQILRGVFMLISTLTGFTTLSYLPQAQATSINFLAPLLVLAVAPWLLGEAPRISRWVAALTGFCGVLIVIRPSSGLDPIGTVFGLLTALLITGMYVVNRLIVSDKSFTTVIWSGGFGSIVLTALLPYSLPLAWPVMSNLSPLNWVVLILTGFWGALGHLLQTQAYHNASASALSPFFYMQIISATILGWLVWDQIPDAFSWLGIALIASSGLVITFVEWRRRHAL